MLIHLRYRPALVSGLAVSVAVTAIGLTVWRPVTALLVGWDIGVISYIATLGLVMGRGTLDDLKRMADRIDEGRWGMVATSIAAALASLCAIVAELAQIHGKPHAGWLEALAGGTVLLSWLFVHTMFATHYARIFWKEGGLSFPGNDRPGYGEFLYFSFCMAVASQVSDVSTQSAGMRRLVLVHSLLAYLFNTAIIALGVNVAASLAG